MTKEARNLMQLRVISHNFCSDHRKLSPTSSLMALIYDEALVDKNGNFSM